MHSPEVHLSVSKRSRYFMPNGTAKLASSIHKYLTNPTGNVPKVWSKSGSNRTYLRARCGKPRPAGHQLKHTDRNLEVSVSALVPLNLGSRRRYL